MLNDKIQMTNPSSVALLLRRTGQFENHKFQIPGIKYQINPNYQVPISKHSDFGYWDLKTTPIKI
jgi:hypothetical protein